MPERPTGLLIGGSPMTLQRLQKLLASLVEVNRSVAVDEGFAAVKDFSFTAVFIDLEADPEKGFGLAERLLKTFPETPIFFTAPKKDVDLIFRAMQLGMRGYLPLQDEEVEVRKIVQTALDERRKRHTGGQILAVFSGKGGGGGTTVAVNLAHQIQRLTGGLVAVVDLNLQMGDLDLFLDLKTCYTIADVMNNLKRLDHTLLLNSLTRHSSGLYALAEPEHMIETETIKGAQVQQVLALLRGHFDYIVLDVSHAIDETSLAALDLADRVFLITQQSIPVIRITQRCLDLFRRLGYSAEKIRLVINRYQEDETMTVKGIEEALGQPVSGTIVNDFAHVIDCINRGVLIAEAYPKSPVNGDLERLAMQVTDATGKTPDTQPFKWGSFFRLAKEIFKK
ncbi:MAG TPA: AAA family ATPase [Nitrospiria bacterium]